MHKGQRRDDVMARVPLPENYLWLFIAGSVWLTHWGAAIPVSQQDRLTLTSPYVSRLFLPNLISSTFVLSSCLWSISALCTSDHADSVKATWCLHQLRSGNTCIAPTQCPTSVFSHTTLCLQASVWQTHSKVNLKQIPLWAILWQMLSNAFLLLAANQQCGTITTCTIWGVRTLTLLSQIMCVCIEIKIRFLASSTVLFPWHHMLLIHVLQELCPVFLRLNSYFIYDLHIWYTVYLCLYPWCSRSQENRNTFIYWTIIMEFYSGVVP